MAVIEIPLESIILDPRLQMRERMDEDTIAEYAECIDALPPGRVVMQEEHIWLTEGWHRYHARNKAGKESMPCEAREGTFLDALLEAVGSNHTHGIRRTNEDKRRAVKAILAEESWKQRTDRAVADACHVSHTFVVKIRAELAKMETFTTETPQSDGNERNHSSGTNTSSSNNSDTKPPNAPPPEILCVSCATKKRKGQERPKKCDMCDLCREEAKAPSTPAAPAQTAAPDAPPKPPVPTDAEGHLITDALLEPFSTVKQFREIDSHLLAVQKLLDGIVKSKGGEEMSRFVNGTTDGKFKSEKLNELKRDVRFSRPHSVCPWCRGTQKKDCKGCRGLGWVAEQTWKGASDDVKARLTCTT